MRKMLLILATTSVLAGGAHANDQTGGTGHSANAGLTGGAMGGAAAATSSQHQQQGQAQSSTSRSKAAGGKGGNVNIGSVGGGGGNNGGGIGLTVPGGYGNAPCGGGVGIGGLAVGGGGSGGGTLWEFGDCKRMRESAALLGLSYSLPEPLASQTRLAALAELCQIDRVKDAFGGSCPTPGMNTVTSVDAGKNDYCFTRNAGDVNQHHECDTTRTVRQ